MQQPLFDNIPAGATIGEIKPLPSDPNLRRVRVGRRTVATLRASDIEALSLTVGMEWSARLARRVAQALAEQAARKQALNLLGKRALSRQQVVERLARKGHARGVAERIASELAADHWIDDRALAESVLRETLRRTPASRDLLVSKLQARGIEPDMADEVARDVLSDADAAAKALPFARRRLAALRAQPIATARRRLASWLARRGFDEDSVATVLAQLHLDQDSDE